MMIDLFQAGEEHSDRCVWSLPPVDAVRYLVRGGKCVLGYKSTVQIQRYIRERILTRILIQPYV